VNVDSRSLVRQPPETPDTTSPGEGSVRRLTRVRAVAAAVAAGGVASLSVVLLGPPALAAETSASPVAVVQQAAAAAEPIRRPDITLGVPR
jgi:hypothetical protein